MKECLFIAIAITVLYSLLLAFGISGGNLLRCFSVSALRHCSQGSCRSAEKQAEIENRNPVPKGLQSTSKPGKSVSSESDYGSTDLTEVWFISDLSCSWI